MENQKVFSFFRQGFVFVVIFFALVAVLATLWVKEHFFIQHFGQILYHLRFPLLNIGEELPLSFAKFCLPPALLAALLLVFLTRKKATIQGVATLAVVFVCAIFINQQLQIADFFKAQSERSDLYEKHYRTFSLTPPPQNLKNLVVIFIESMSSAFTTDSVPTGELPETFAPYGNLTPHLGALAKENVNFSATSAVGGITQVFGTGWTTAGMASYLCAIPINLPYGKHLVLKHYFLDSAVCLTDILNAAGFKQIRISGIADVFGGVRNFYQKHKVEVHDLPYFQKIGVVPKKLNTKEAGAQNVIWTPGKKANKAIGKEYWGINDHLTFSLAEKEIRQLANSKKPFAAYISTMDTHPPFGFVDPEFCPDLPRTLRQSFTCSERVILDFVQKIKDIPNTAIILLGDHLPVDVAELKNQGIYNAFLNPAFLADSADSAMLEKTKNRKLSHFDVAPLILESVGIPAESFGLGRNPLKTKTLLESDFSLEDFNQQLLRGNKMYDDFWKNPR